jgi:hypothetical protein
MDLIERHLDRARQRRTGWLILPVVFLMSDMKKAPQTFAAPFEFRSDVVAFIARRNRA